MRHSSWALWLVVFLIGAAIGFRFGAGGPEDAWRCEDGAWVRHGNPSAPMPSEPCPDGTPAPSGDIVCTMEARQCPDGSYVGRTGPRCEFAPCPSTRQVYLYYYDLSRDKDDSGNVLCSAQGVVPVSRDIAITKTPIGDTIRLLLKGELTAAERASGLSTEFPLPGLTLAGASLTDGALTLTFNDPGNKTTGGSCRVGILWAQIENTARQFDEVTSVRFAPDSLFQP